MIRLLRRLPVHRRVAIGWWVFNVTVALAVLAFAFRS